LVVRPLPSPRRFGEQLELVVNEQLPPGQFAPGEVAPMRLTWRALQPIQTRYKISVQLLDGRNQVVAQQDSEPAGGALPTDGWQVGATYADQRSLFVPFGLPPGHYQLIVAVYDPATGQRLPTAQGDGATLDQLEIIANPKPIPLEIIPMQYRFQQRIGPVRLAGYNLHRKGFAHAPETPVAAGDLVHLTFYWQAPSPLPADWPTDLAFTLRLGEQTLTAPLAGGAYPTSRWHAGELVRGEFDLVYDGTARRPLLTVGGEQVRLAGVAR
jgi:mannosyltransferase